MKDFGSPKSARLTLAALTLVVALVWGAVDAPFADSADVVSICVSCLAVGCMPARRWRLDCVFICVVLDGVVVGGGGGAN